MKNKIIFLMLGIFLISFSSALEIDNKVTYSEEDLKVTLHNSFLGIIKTSELGTAKLKSHKSVNQILHVAPGKDRVPMYYDLDWKNSGDRLGSVEFIDIKSGESIYKDYHFVIWDKVYEEKNEYSEECSLVYSKTNSSYSRVCEQIVVGTYIEESYDWVRLNVNEIPIGKIRIGLATDVELGDTIDAIWEIAGKKIDKHAVWTASLNVELVSYWKCDDNATNTTVIDSHASNTGTASNNTIDLSEAGIINSAFGLNGVNEEIVITHTAALAPTTGSISTWVNPVASHAVDGYMIDKDLNTDNGYGIILRTDNTFDFFITTSGGLRSITDIPATTGSWQHLGMTWDNTAKELKAYKNGSQAGSTLSFAGENVLTGTSDLHFGNKPSGTDRWYEGVIDETGVWNRTLDPTEMSQLYSNGTGISYTDNFLVGPNVTLNSPVDNINYTTSPLQVNFSCYASDDINLTSVGLYIDGSLDQLNASGINNTNYTFAKTLTEGNYNWTCEGTDNESQTTKPIERIFTIHTTAPDVNITAPSGISDYFLLGEDETLIYNISEANQSSSHFDECWYDYYNQSNSLTNPDPSNIGVWLDGNPGTRGFRSGSLSVQNEIQTLNLSYSNTNFNDTAGYLINISGCNITNGKKTLNISNGVTAVLDNWQAISCDSTLLLNKTSGIFGGSAPAELRLVYDSTPLNCSENTVNFTYIKGKNDITVFAKDNFGFLANGTSSWSYKVLEINQTYNNITAEGANEEFKINFAKDASSQISVIYLVYNGTINSFPYSISGNNVISQGNIIIPEVSSDTNVSFHWNIIMSDGSNIITESKNQTILEINVDDCSLYTNLIYNFTQYDEENLTMLNNNNTVELQINLYDTNKIQLLTNFSGEFTNINPVQFCAEDPILPTVEYSSYVVVKYHANNSDTGKSYSVEYYNILNQTISNSTVPYNIALYNLKTDDTTKFRLTFRDGEYVLAPNILVQVHRQYIKDNDFKIVEIPITDSNGQTVLNLVKDTIIYNFIMVNEAGETVGTFNSIKAFCSDFSIGDCTINLAPDSLSEDSYDYNEEFDISISDPSYDNSTKRISVSFVTGDLTPKTVKMEVIRNNQFGNRSVCSDSLLAASGVLSCNISSVTDTDQFLFVSTFVEDDLAKMDTTSLNSDILNFGTLNGAFYAFLMFLFIISMFMEDKKALVMSLGLGWVAVISLGLLNGKLIGFTSAGIWILISIAIFLWKLNSEESA